MRLKLDENLGDRIAQLCREGRHDTVTVREQGMSSAGDVEVLSACKSEERCLVTLDLDFSNPIVFPPSEHGGIAVLRLRPKTGITELLDGVRTFLAALDQREIAGRLWVVQRGRIRECQPDD